MEHQNQEKCDHCRNECCGALHAEIIINRSSEIIIEKSRKQCKCEVSEFQKNESSYKAYTKKCKNSEDSTFETIINKEDCYKSEYIYPPGGNDCDEQSTEVATRNSSASGEDKVDVYKVINKELKHRIKGVNEDTLNPVTKNSSEANVVNVERDEAIKLNGKSKSRSLDDKKLTEYLNEDVKLDEKIQPAQKSQEPTGKQKKASVKEKREAKEEIPNTSEIEEQVYTPRRVRDTINRLNRLSESNQESSQYDQKFIKKKKPLDVKFEPDVAAWSYLNSENEKSRTISVDVEVGDISDIKIENMQEIQTDGKTKKDVEQVTSYKSVLTNENSEKDDNGKIVQDDSNNFSNTNAEVDESKNDTENSTVKTGLKTGKQDGKEKNKKKKKTSKEKDTDKVNINDIENPSETVLNSEVSLNDSQDLRKTVHNEYDLRNKRNSESEPQEFDIPPKNMVRSIIQLMEMKHRELSEDRNRSRDASLEPKDRPRKNTRDSSNDKFEDDKENTLRKEQNIETAKMTVPSSKDNTKEKKSPEKKIDSEMVTDADDHVEDNERKKVSNLMRKFENNEEQDKQDDEKASSKPQNIEIKAILGEEETENNSNIIDHSNRENSEKPTDEGNLTFNTLSHTVDNVMHLGTSTIENENAGENEESVDEIESSVASNEKHSIEKLDKKDNGKTNEYVDYIIEVIKDPLNLGASNNNVFDTAFRNTNNLNDTELRKSLDELANFMSMDEQLTDDDIDSPYPPKIHHRKLSSETEETSDIGEEFNQPEKILQAEDNSTNKSSAVVKKTSPKAIEPKNETIELDDVEGHNSNNSANVSDNTTIHEEVICNKHLQSEKTLLSSSISSTNEKESSLKMPEFSKKSSNFEGTVIKSEGGQTENNIESDKDKNHIKTPSEESDEYGKENPPDSKRERKNTLEKIKIEKSVKHLSNSTETVEKCVYESFSIESCQTEGMSDEMVQQELRTYEKHLPKKTHEPEHNEVKIEKPNPDEPLKFKHVSSMPTTETKVSGINISEKVSNEKDSETLKNDDSTIITVESLAKHENDALIEIFPQITNSEVDDTIVVESETELKENIDMDDKSSIEDLRKEKPMEETPNQHEESISRKAGDNSHKDEITNCELETISRRGEDNIIATEHADSMKQIVSQNYIDYTDMEEEDNSMKYDSQTENNEAGSITKEDTNGGKCDMVKIERRNSEDVHNQVIQNESHRQDESKIPYDELSKAEDDADIEKGSTEIDSKAEEKFFDLNLNTEENSSSKLKHDAKSDENEAEVTLMENEEAEKGLKNQECEERDKELNQSTLRLSQIDESEIVKSEEELKDLQNIMKNFNEDIDIVIVENNEAEDKLNSIVMNDVKETNFLSEQIEINEQSKVPSLMDTASTKNSILNSDEILTTEREEKLPDEENESLKQGQIKLQSVFDKVKEMPQTLEEENYRIQTKEGDTAIPERRLSQTNKKTGALDIDLKNDISTGFRSEYNDVRDDSTKLTSEDDAVDGSIPNEGILIEEVSSITENQKNTVIKIEGEENINDEFTDNDSTQMVRDSSSRLPRSIEKTTGENLQENEKIVNSGNLKDKFESDKSKITQDGVAENYKKSDTQSYNDTIKGEENTYKSPDLEISNDIFQGKKEIITDIEFDGQPSNEFNQEQKNFHSEIDSSEAVNTMETNSLIPSDDNQVQQGEVEAINIKDDNKTINGVNKRQSENTHEEKSDLRMKINTEELHLCSDDKDSESIDDSKETESINIISKYADITNFIHTERQFDVHDNDTNKDIEKQEFKEVSNMVKNIEDITHFLQKESKGEERGIDEDGISENNISQEHLNTSNEIKSSNLSCHDNLRSDNLNSEQDLDIELNNEVDYQNSNIETNMCRNENIDESSRIEQSYSGNKIERSSNISFIDIIDGHDNKILRTENFENVSKCVFDNDKNESLRVEKTWDAGKDEMKLDISHTFEDTENKTINVVAQDEDYPNISVQIKISYNTAEEKGSLDQKFTLNNREIGDESSEPMDNEIKSVMQKQVVDDALPKTDITCLKKSTYTCVEENYENENVVKNVLKKKTNIINDQNLLRNKDSKVTEVMRKIESFDAFEDPKTEHHIGKLTMKKHTMREVKSFEYQEIYDDSKENLHQYQRKRTGRKKVNKRSLKNSKEENSSEDSKHTDSDTSSIEHEMIISEPPSKENRDGVQWRLEGMPMASTNVYPSKSRNLFPRSSYYNAADVKHLVEDKMNNESYQMNLNSNQDLNIKNKNKPIQKIKNKTRSCFSNKLYEDHQTVIPCTACTYVENNKPLFITTVKKGTFLEPPPDVAAMLGLTPKETSSENRNNVVYSFSSKPRLCQHKRENLKSELHQG